VLNSEFNEHFQTIINSSPDIIVLKDVKSRWILTNKVTREIFNIGDIVYKGKDDLELGKIYPGFAQYAANFIKSDSLAWELGYQIEAKEIVNINGQERIFNVVKTPIYDNEGNRNALLVIGRDITELLKSQQRYKSLYFEHPYGVYSLDKEGRFLEVNQQALELTGYSKDELIGLHFDSIIAPEGLPEVLEGFSRVLQGEPQGQETQLIRRNGEIRYIQFMTIPAELNGEIIGIQGIAHDITSRKRLEVLREHQSIILEKIAKGDPITEIQEFIINTVEKLLKGVGSLMFFEKEHDRLRVGYAPHLANEFIEIIDFFPFSLKDAFYDHSTYTKDTFIFMNMETDPAWSRWRTDVIKHNLRSCWSVPIISTKGSLLGILIIYLREIRKPTEFEIDILKTFGYLTGLAIERNKHEEEIQFLADHDVLTDLPNLRYLKEIFPKIVEQSTDLAVMVMDLDKFKSVNDIFGHNYGDILLKKITERMKKAIGEPHIVARMGGDEFVFLVQNISNRQMVYSLANQILQAIEKPVWIDDREFYVTGSIGISLYGEHGETIEQLMRNADVAMYHIKDMGGNSKRIYETQMNDKAYDFFILKGDFRKAVEQNQFNLHYQPKVDVKTGAITGVEALVRWEHPERGQISPNMFIPLAEESDFILELGSWVIDRACKQLKEWKKEGLDISIAVNVSVKQLIKQNIPALVKAKLEELALPPSSLEIEITESILSTHESLIRESVNKLQQIGVKVSIDDFGTGYASLTYLKQFKTNTIKIDRSFIRFLPENRDDAAIVSAVLTLAKELELNVIAEGVETKEQLDFLIGKGCREVQGYLFSKPLPSEEVLNLLKKRFIVV
jgi:diguanylate cyclase (GGDEF)-like protein/PAS domain S-box-containing protein